MKRLFGFLLVCIFLAWTSGGLQARTVQVDGNFLDWGINTSSFGANDNDWSSPYPDVYVAQEDWVNASDGYVGPGYGWQPYDAEALMMTWDLQNLYLGLATGFDLSGQDYNGSTKYPGDLLLDLGADGTYDYAFVFTPGDRSLSTGLYQVFSDAAFEDTAYYSSSDPFRLDTSQASLYSYLVSGSYSFNYDGSIPRSLLEVSIPWSALGNYYGPISVHWTMWCGNDALDLTAVHTPEPASLLLVGSALGLVGFLGRRIRRNT